jgi:carotenoid cleavage dioxygenase
MLQLLYGFLPWILFSAIFGKNGKDSLIAIIVALVVCIKTERTHLRKGFVLSWGTVIFFILLFFLAVVARIPWVIDNASMLSNLTLALIAWISLFIGQPFTLQYAREQTPQQIWKTPGFIKVNQILTIIWGLIFLFSVLLHYLRSYIPKSEAVLYPILSYGSIILGLWFTKKFPMWYRSKQLYKKNRENPYLKNNYAPIHEESDFNDLIITGKFPENLQGVYMRNGPNPAFEPISYTYPIDGDGMLHAVYLKNNTANYRNRYVKTKGLLAEQRVGRAIYGGVMQPIMPDPKLIGKDGELSPFKNGAFIHIIEHATHYLAMWENGPAYEVDINLDTLGEWQPQNANKPISTSPHTRLDPETGDLYLICNYIKPPYLVYHRVDKNGTLVESKTIEKTYGSLIHDFVLTKNFLIVFDCPAIFDEKALETGGQILQWRPELGTRIGIISRHDQAKPAQWLTTEPFFVFHFANAYEESNNIIIDYVRHEKIELGSDIQQRKIAPSLYRMHIDLTKQTLAETCLNELRVEFPTFNRAFNTKHYRYIYAPTQTIPHKKGFNALVKYDLQNQTTTIHDFGTNAGVEEAVFAPNPLGTQEDEGYLMLFVYDEIKNMSDLVILDAQNLAAEPLAKIHIPRRIPYGLHGSWFAE